MSLILKKSIFIALSSLALSGPVSASSLYVSAHGSDSNCTKHSPCSTIQEAVNLSEVGDTIHIGEGKFHENITIPAGKSGLTIKGEGDDETIIFSAGADATPKFAPQGVPVDIIFDVFSSDVTIENLATVHPKGDVTKRDIGIFARPPANNLTVKKCKIERNRTGADLEPFTPGSRGILVFRATGSIIYKNELEGNYQDHLHIASNRSTITKNEIEGATRLGIVIIQETPDSDSTGSIIKDNEVEESGSDGIQIQGDNNIISNNELEENGGVGIKLCGAGDCVAPGFTSIASGNIVLRNEFDDNTLGGLVDDGTENTVN